MGTKTRDYVFPVIGLIAALGIGIIIGHYAIPDLGMLCGTSKFKLWQNVVFWVLFFWDFGLVVIENYDLLWDLWVIHSMIFIVKLVLQMIFLHF